MEIEGDSKSVWAFFGGNENVRRLIVVMVAKL